MSDSIVRTLGGQRIGTGNQMKVRMHNFERSSHNMSREWKSSLNVGTLVPCFKEMALPGDAFDIDIETLVKTQPTTGPLFGTFKLQLDLFSCPIRLYNGALHNNTLGIGMKMNEIKLPKWSTGGVRNIKFTNDCLWTYLGIRGLGTKTQYNALPLVAYYDIFKNYYANKQERHAQVINPRRVSVTPTGMTVDTYGDTTWNTSINESVSHSFKASPIGQSEPDKSPKKITLFTDVLMKEPSWIDYMSKSTDVLQFQVQGNVHGYTFREIADWTVKNDGASVSFVGQGKNGLKQGIVIEISDYNKFYSTKLGGNKTVNQIIWLGEGDVQNGYLKIKEISIVNFELKEIDTVREKILSAGKNNLDVTKLIPMNFNTVDKSMSKQAGLCVKTYLSDKFNNWLNSETITGNNGIAAITAVDTSSGSFTIDSLILANKVYNMLNRIAVSGGTYDDWQEVVYGEQLSFRAESPIYLGGLAREIYFDEVVSTADASAEGNEVPLGSLAGRGVQSEKRGGKVSFRVNEPSYIMGIVSITPRIDYSQGNNWMAYLDNVDELHKPNLDGIGFQDLMMREMKFADGRAAGKQPAWLHYMTSYNENYGDFATGGSLEHMVLNRNYSGVPTGNVDDLTTYIDPRKYNYVFADSSLEAENFWIQIGFNVLARRKMSAKIMPNL